MFNLKSVAIASAALLVLNACSSSSSSSSSNGSPVSVAAVSGVDADLTGTYATGCHPDDLDSVTEDLVISGNTWNYTRTVHSDAACTIVTDNGAISGTFAVDGTVIAISGWVDGTGANDAAPVAADNSFSISGTQDVTPLKMTVVSASGSFGGISIGFEAPLFYVVDDTGPSNILYRDFDYENGSTKAGNFDPFTKQ